MNDAFKRQFSSTSYSPLSLEQASKCINKTYYNNGWKEKDIMLSFMLVHSTEKEGSYFIEIKNCSNSEIELLAKDMTFIRFSSNQSLLPILVLKNDKKHDEIKQIYTEEKHL